MRTSVSVVLGILIVGNCWSLAHCNPTYSVTGVAILDSHAVPYVVIDSTETKKSLVAPLLNDGRATARIRYHP
jgi:hypothetical protein